MRSTIERVKQWAAALVPNLEPIALAVLAVGTASLWGFIEIAEEVGVESRRKPSVIVDDARSAVTEYEPPRRRESQRRHRGKVRRHRRPSRRHSEM